MVKAQKLLSGPALASAAPPVGGDNGFAPVLSASRWKESVMKLFVLFAVMI